MKLAWSCLTWALRIMTTCHLIDRMISGSETSEMIDVQISPSQTLMVKSSSGWWRCSDIWSPFFRCNNQFALQQWAPTILQALLSKLQVLGYFPLFHQQGELGLGSGSSQCSLEDLKVNLHFSPLVVLPWSTQSFFHLVARGLFAWVL